MPDRPLDELVQAVRNILSKLRASHPSYEGMKLDLLPAQKGTFYFQSVLAPVDPIPQLVDLNAACQKEFGPSSKPYFPHLSLLYGDISAERRNELSALVNGGLEVGKVPKSLEIKEAVFVRCEGPADGWEVVASVPL